ncbi:MAG: alkylmercury lyase [Acidobacteria bacterium]|nr:MAG: alkylmercury lyase [Acidobacteriota bacterium]GIK77761.1 MAG: alkylmercury lyase [Actinomycetes bacterium]
MSAQTADRVAGVLARSMERLRGDGRSLALSAYRLLSAGSPVPVADLAAASRVQLEEAEAWLEEMPGVFRDEDGRVVGFWGLAIAEMPHRFEVDGVDLYAWCAWDTLFMPALIGKPARVRSACRQTAERITFTVDAERVSEISHPDAVVSMLASEEGLGADVLTAFCHHVHFFVSESAGERWLAEREDDDAFLLTVAEAHRLGRLWNEHRFGEAVVV